MGINKLPAIKLKGVASKFLESDAATRVLIGPVGSGKSSAAAFALAKLALTTPPMQGTSVSQSRSIIIRNTYRELEDSCIKTFFQWVPEELGHWAPGDMMFTISIPGYHHHTFSFRAIDSAGDIGKLLSTEYSYAWLSEARELPEELIQMLPARLRFPPRSKCPEFVGRTVIESNPSDKTHWLYTIAAETTPADWALFMQPSGLSPEAENIENLPKDYYQKLIHNRPQNWIDCFVHGKWSYVSGDLPVFPEFSEARNVTKQPIEPIEDYRVIVGLDFGLTPAAVFLQQVNGQYRVTDEICTTNMGAVRLGKEINRMLQRRYPGCKAELWGDPAGSQRAQTDENTPYMMLEAEGITAYPTHTNDFSIRREAVAAMLLGTTMQGTPALVISPNCKTLIRGLAGDYKYSRIQVSGTARYSAEPHKSSSSHVCDALEYAMLGAGEGEALFGNAWGDNVAQSRGINGYSRGKRL